MRVYAIGSTMLLSVYSHGATDIHTLDYDGRWRLSSLPTTRTDIARIRHIAVAPRVQPF